MVMVESFEFLCLVFCLVCPSLAYTHIILNGTQ